MSTPIATRADAEAADASDVLAAIRARFAVPPGIYLDGNSLGALPEGVAAAVAGAVTGAWGRDLIASWNDNGWWALPGRVGNRIGALIGAGPGQVMCGDSTSVQLFQALVALARANPRRRVIAVDAGDFPTDRYLTDSVARLLDLTVERVDPTASSQTTVRRWWRSAPSTSPPVSCGTWSGSPPPCMPPAV